tara:strand:+ start:196 stop:486 length:291 start_codon:yes stop_codon:yes gene_type:complete
MNTLNTNELNENLKTLKGWEFKDNSIFRSYKFSTYMDGIGFVHALALLSEKENHHPDISIGWCQVDIAFTSHDLGGVTDSCIKMATFANNIFDEKK